MVKKEALLQVKLTNEQKGKIQAEAEKQNLKVSEYVLTALDFFTGSDSFFWEKIKTIGRKSGIPEYLLIQNLLLTLLANREAHFKVFGYLEEPMIEFMINERGPITGEELFNIQLANAIKQFENEKEQTLIKKAQYGPLSIEEQAWLDDHRVKADRDETLKKFKEYEKQGLFCVFR